MRKGKREKGRKGETGVMFEMLYVSVVNLLN
jgi:hypothetical protein